MSFSKDLAIKIARLSLHSYFEKTYEYKNKSFLIHEEKDAQYLLFAGSYEIEDWMENAEFIKVKRDGLGWIHNGFQDAWDDLKKEVMKSINPIKKLYIGGHSLGGAEASIAALYLKNKGYKIEAVYTYGSPRVGNSDWKKNFSKSGIEYYRIVNGNDIVSSVPKIFFYHVGKEIHINRRPFFSWFHNRFLDHKIENYIDNLYKLG